MSRIGKQPIDLPENVSASVDGRTVSVEGPEGALTLEVHPLVEVTVEDAVVRVVPVEETRDARALWGTMRSLIANMVTGVSEGYRTVLEIEGVGYRANLQGSNLELNVGYSHPVTIEAPDNITFEVEDNTTIVVSGPDKQQVGETSAVIRAVRPPEPYKGKGIRYRDEVIRRKQGKRAVGAME